MNASGERDRSCYVLHFLACISLILFCMAGCSAPPQQVRFVPSSTVFQVEPQPSTTEEFRETERGGYLVAATGRGTAFGADDLPTVLQAGERLHVIRGIPDADEILVKRLDYHMLARISRDGLEVRGSTFPDRN